MLNNTFLEQICEGDLILATVQSTGVSLTILLEVSVLEAGKVTHLGWAPQKEDIESSMRVQVVYLDADAREHW